MRFLPYVFLAACAGVLAWIGLRAPERNYEPLILEAAQPDTYVPRAVLAAVPDGHALRRLHVDGMCCNGCTKKLYDALTALPEVAAAAIDFEGREASALVPEDLPVERLISALSFDKYTAVLLD